MYKFRRLRSLLRQMSVTALSRRRMYLRWLWVMLGYVAAIGFALAEVFKTPHDWPITWRDFATHDEIMRSFLLSSYAAFATGCYTLIGLISTARGASTRMMPLPDVASALRKVARERDPRIVVVVQDGQGEHCISTDTLEDGNTIASASLRVATPELLTGSLWLFFSVFVVGLLPLSMIAGLAALTVALDTTPQALGPALGAQDVYLTLRFIGIFSPLVVIAYVNAWRYLIRWLATIRGAEVVVSVEGLGIRDQETLWRRRFISWGRVSSLMNFTYNDTYVRPRTIYLLDADDQTFLWESPPDMRYASPARRGRIAERQAQSAQLVACIGAATRLPLLNLTGVVTAVAKIEPDPYSTSNEPDPRDIALLEFIEGGTAANDLKPPASLPTRAEQWRRLLMSGLIGIALLVGLLWLFPGLGH